MDTGSCHLFFSAVQGKVFLSTSQCWQKLVGFCQVSADKRKLSKWISIPFHTVLNNGVNGLAFDVTVQAMHIKPLLLCDSFLLEVSFSFLFLFMILYRNSDSFSYILPLIYKTSNIRSPSVSLFYFSLKKIHIK